MRLVFLFALALLLSQCTPSSFDPASADADIPAETVDARLEKLIRAEGKLYLHGRPVSGWVVDRYPNGQMKRREGYLNGRRHGSTWQWYANGQLKEQRHYRDGSKEGEHRGWWEDGKTRFAFHFRAGQHHGSAREWNAAGMLFRDFHYEAGREAGPQRMWRPDGRIQANYEVRDGRRFGYIGTKNCMSVSPESSNTEQYASE